MSVFWTFLSVIVVVASFSMGRALVRWMWPK